MSSHKFLKNETPQAIAHRGGSFSGAENTMNSFEHAINMGFKVLETDIQTTKDNKLIVFHDLTLDRLTNEKGTVREKTWNELKDIKILGKFQIPLLSDVFEIWPEIKINIDPKNDHCMDELISFLKNNNYFDRICIGSFSGKRLEKLRNVFGSKLCTSAGPKEVLKLKLASISQLNISINAQCVQVPVKYYGIKIIDKNFVEFCHSLNLKVHVWTINDILEMKRLLDLGVDGIISDNLEGLKRVFSKRNIW